MVNSSLCVFITQLYTIPTTEQLCKINSYMPGHKLYTCDMIGQHETKKKKKSVNFFCFFEQQDK